MALAVKSGKWRENNGQRIMDQGEIEVIENGKTENIKWHDPGKTVCGSFSLPKSRLFNMLKFRFYDS